RPPGGGEHRRRGQGAPAGARERLPRRGPVFDGRRHDHRADGCPDLARHRRGEPRPGPGRLPHAARDARAFHRAPLRKGLNPTSTGAEDVGRIEESEAPPAPAPRRRLRNAALVAAAVLASVAAYELRPASRTAPADYVTVAVDRGRVEQSVNATGTVNPVTTV